jgi:hypothetical protein
MNDENNLTGEIYKQVLKHSATGHSNRWNVSPEVKHGVFQVAFSTNRKTFFNLHCGCKAVVDPSARRRRAGRGTETL